MGKKNNKCRHEYLVTFTTTNFVYANSESEAIEEAMYNVRNDVYEKHNYDVEICEDYDDEFTDEV